MSSFKFLRLFGASSLIGLILSSPLVAFSQSGSGELEGIDIFERELELQIEGIMKQQEDLETELLEELFPEGVENVEDTSRKRNIEEGDYVVIRVHGVPVVLGDVPRTEWFGPFIRDIADRGIVSGYLDEHGLPLGLFGPADHVTIEQLAKIVIEAAEVDQSACNEDLKNVTASGSWSAPYIRCAEHYGWAVFSDGSIDVKRDALRSEVVVTILQAFEVAFDETSGALFTDVSSSTQFSFAIETAARDRVVSGYTDELGEATGEFGPDDPVNRAEVSKIVSLALQVYTNR